MNTIEYYAVMFSGGSYEDAFDVSHIFIGKSEAETYFDKIRYEATEHHRIYDHDGYSNATDIICITKATVDENGMIVPDWFNPIMEIEWNYKTKQWKESED